MPDLVARLKLDSTPAQESLKKTTAEIQSFGTRSAPHFAALTKESDKLGGSVVRLHESLGKFGPLGLAVSQNLDTLGLGAAGAEAGIAGLAAAGVGAAAAIGFKLAKAASDLNEQVTASRVVFGAAADTVDAYAKSMAAAGLSEKDALEATTAIATSLKAVGFTDASLTRVSESLVSLATDLSSFSNIPVPEALEAIQAALRGEFDPLERFQVHLNENAVAAEAVREGLAKSTSQLDAASKAAATINLILGQTATQQNDVARSGGTLAGNMRELNAVWENTQTEIGQGILPAFVKLSSAGLELIDVVRGIGPWYDKLTGQSDALAKIWVTQHPLVHSIASEIGQLADHFQGASKAQHDYSQGQVTAADITKQATAAAKAQNDALQKTHDLLLGTFNADLQYQEAQFSLRDAVDKATKAQSDLNDAIKQSGPNSQQAKDAQEALQKANLDVQQSALQSAQAAVELQSKWTEEAGGTYGARQSTRDMIVALEQAEAQMNGPSRAAIDGYIARLKAIDRDITTTVHFRVDQAGGPQSLEGRASGGPVMPGRSYLVGERGPELLTLGRAGGFVVPNYGAMMRSRMNSLYESTMPAMASASGSASPGSSGASPVIQQTNNFTISGDGVNADQVAIAIDRRVNRLLTSA